MSGELIGWIITGVVALFIVAGILWGLLRGMVRSTSRIVWVVVTAVILLFITPLITKSVYTIDFGTLFGGVELLGVPFTSVDGFIETFLDSNPTDPTAIAIQSLLDGNPNSIALVKELPFLLLNCFVFVILFWIAKIILWPLWAILTAVIFKKNDKAGNPKKRNRLAGMGIGLVLGLFISAMTLMPVVNTFNMLTELERKSAQGREQGIIATFAGEEAMPYVNAYENSAARFLLRYSGMEWISSLFFKQLSSTTIDGKKIDLSKELVSVGALAADANELVAIFSEENLTQANLDRALVLARNIINDVLDSQIVASVADELMAYMIDSLLNETSFIELPELEQPYLNVLIKDTLQVLSGWKDNPDGFVKIIKEDINSLLDIVDVLNREGILMGFIAGEQLSVSDVLNKFTPAVISDISDCLFDMNMAELVPYALRAATNVMGEMLEIAGFTNDALATTAGLKNAFDTIVGTAFEVIGIFDLEGGSMPPVEDIISILPKVGKVIDSVMDCGLLSAQAYETLMLQLEGMVTDAITDMLSESDMSIPATLTNPLFAIIGNIKTLDSFETEFTIFASIATAVFDLVNSEDLQIDDRVLADIGGLLDQLKTTELIGDEFENLVVGVIDLAKGMAGEAIDDPAMANMLSDLIDIIKDNFENFDGEYATELPKFLTLVEIVMGLMDSMDEGADIMDVLFADDGNIFVTLGGALDVARDNALIGDAVDAIVIGLLNFMDTLLADMELPADVDLSAILGGVIYNIETAVTNEEEIIYADEFANLAAIFGSVFGMMDDMESGDLTSLLSGTMLSDLGAALDGAADSVMFGNGIINGIVCELLTVLGDSLAGDLPFDVNSMIAGMVFNIQGAASISYESEFAGLGNVFGSVFGLMDEMDGGDLTAILGSGMLTDLGEVLDSLSSSVLFGNGLVRGLVGELLSMIGDSLAGDLPFDVNSMIGGMISNLQGATSISYASEFEGLGHVFGAVFGLMDAMDGGDIQALLGSGMLTDLGTVFDSLSESVLFGNGLVNGLVSELLNLMGTSLAGDLPAGMDTLFNGLMGGIIGNLNLVTSYEDEFGHLGDFFGAVFGLMETTDPAALEGLFTDLYGIAGVSNLITADMIDGLVMATAITEALNTIMTTGEPSLADAIAGIIEGSSGGFTQADFDFIGTELAPVLLTLLQEGGFAAIEAAGQEFGQGMASILGAFSGAPSDFTAISDLIASLPSLIQP